MADLVAGFVSSAFICGLGIILVKRCIEYDERVKDEQEEDREYILITKEHYKIKRKNPDVKKIIYEQPQIRPQKDEAPLPSYSQSETDTLLSLDAPQMQMQMQTLDANRLLK